jgi:hypothetical protein
MGCKTSLQLPAEEKVFVSGTASRLALRLALSSIQWVLGAFSLGVKCIRYGALWSPPSSAEIKNTWSFELHSLTHTYMARYIVSTGDKFNEIQFALCETILLLKCVVGLIYELHRCFDGWMDRWQLRV